MLTTISDNLIKNKTKCLNAFIEFIVKEKYTNKIITIM